MLENLRNFPRDFVDIEYQDYTDGIITGLIPTVYEKKITFSKGIIKYEGTIYLINEPLSVSYADTNNEVMIKLNLLERLDDEDFITQCIDIKLDFDMSVKKGQLELGRFKLKSGAYLRSDYKGMYDFATEYNTINIIHTQIAAQEESTIHPSILKFFATEVLETGTDNMMDMNFAFACLNCKVVARKVITAYIGYKLNVDCKEMSNGEIHNNLVSILKLIQNDRRKSATVVNFNTKIIVD
jgi:hypothetical protein